MATGSRQDLRANGDHDHVRQDGVTGPARKLRGRQLCLACPSQPHPCFLPLRPGECSGKLPCILCAVGVPVVLAETLPGQ
jgi:hypothetical protein